MFRKAEPARTTHMNLSSAWSSGSPKNESRSTLVLGAEQFSGPPQSTLITCGTEPGLPKRKKHAAHSAAAEKSRAAFAT